MQNLKSKRFVVRKSLIGKNQIIEVTFKNGKPNGEWEIFANGFSGLTGEEKVKNPRNAKARPCGLAQGPDGSLYVSDDSKGAIFKISYSK